MPLSRLRHKLSGPGVNVGRGVNVDEGVEVGDGTEVLVGSGLEQAAIKHSAIVRNRERAISLTFI